MTNENPKLTITLTGRRPVSIIKADWPVVASAKDWDNEHECQANRTYKLLVRQHQDGRALVYGIYDTDFTYENGRRGGEMVEADADIPAAIKRVGEYLEMSRDLIDECVADLPAEDLATA